MTKYFLDDFNTAVAYIEYYFNIRKFSVTKNMNLSTAVLISIKLL